ncbi:membrane dipeptidase [uncultured Sphaerochaeta sp.]|uniref:dipeptidase n=1 Tax=uncultured Sphaerochaeta sp. TaxID=886478 RepID=UPI002A0A8039|nr:membrane dipeptidase [uncultured Sphaerochaeta sp.]
MRTMIDLHCDTFYEMHEYPQKGDLAKNTLSVDIGKMQKGNVGASCFALFVHWDKNKDSWTEVCKLHDLFVDQLALNKENIVQVRTATDFRQNDRLGAILTCEEGQIIEGDLSRLAILADWGVRLFTLTWNFENDLGYPHSVDAATNDLGLKPLGIEAIGEMERQNILVDVSHLNDGGFWDVVRHAKKPFLASHSNSRYCTPVSRNLSDEMLKALADKGGIAGLNLYPAFLSSDAEHASRISDMVRHVEHIYKVSGLETLALGTDFDGIDGDLEIPDISQMGKLWDALKLAHFTESELDRMWQINALRLLGE